MAKVQVNPQDLTKLKISKHRNNKKKGIVFVDASGKEIKGHPVKNALQTMQKVEARFQTKFEAFSLLDEQAQKELFLNPTKPQITSNTDKQALVQAYFNTVFTKYENLTLFELQTMKTDLFINNLNDVEKAAFEKALEVASEKQQLEQVQE